MPDTSCILVTFMQTPSSLLNIALCICDSRHGQDDAHCYKTCKLGGVTKVFSWYTHNIPNANKSSFPVSHVTAVWTALLQAVKSKKKIDHASTIQNKY